VPAAAIAILLSLGASGGATALNQPATRTAAKVPISWAKSVGTASQYQLNDLDFPTPQAGWAVGTVSSSGGRGVQGVILASRTSGSSWRQQWRGREEPFEITAIDGEQAWALSSMGCAAGEAGKPCPSALLGTTDGGTTWAQMATFPSGLDQIAFSSSTVGVAGASSQICPQPTGNAAPSCPGSVLVTTNGGAKWTMALRTPDPVVAVTATTGELLAVEAFLTGYTGPGSLAVLVSTDQGRSWRSAGRVTIPSQLSLETTAKLLVGPKGELWLSLMDRESCAMHGCGTVGVWASPDGGASWSQQLPSAPNAADDCSDSAPASTLSGSPDGAVYGIDEVNLAACPPPGATLVSWDTAQAPTINSAQSVYSFSAFTPTVVSWPSRKLGFAASPTGITRTEDGGQSWQQVFPALAPVDALDVVSSTVAYGGGDQAFPNAVLGTTDGGRQWRVLDNLLGPVDLLDFLNPTSGYAVVGTDSLTASGSSAIYSTSDGGHAWNFVGSGPPHPGGSLIGLTILKNGSGVTADATASSKSCSLWVTHDSGISWHRTGPIPTAGYGCSVVAASFAASRGKPGPGAVVEVGTNPVRETKDLGRRWSETPPHPRLGGIQLLSAALQVGWTESFSHSGRTEKLILWESTNGGRSWSTPDPKGQVLPPGSNSGSPVTLSFAGPRIAWLMAAGSVWRTVDGGRTWLAAAAASTS
jgi:photosystem II stability/assembly factor-like uncharacterized protein